MLEKINDKRDRQSVNIGKSFTRPSHSLISSVQVCKIKIELKRRYKRVETSEQDKNRGSSNS